MGRSVGKSERKAVVTALLACLVLFCAAGAFAGDCPAQPKPWSKTHANGLGLDAHALCPTADGGFLVGGSWWGDGVNVLKQTAWVGEFTCDGQPTGAGPRAFLGAQDVHKIIRTSDGGFLAVGVAYGSAWAAKLNRRAGLVWQKTYHDGGQVVNHEEFWDVAEVFQPPNGSHPQSLGYIAVGQSYLFNDYDAWVVSLDREGEICWQARYGIWGYDGAQAAEMTGNGELMVVGSTNVFNVQTPWVLKLGEGGTILRQNQYVMQGVDARPFDCRITYARGPKGELSEDGLLIGGTIYGSWAPDGECWVARLDPDGAVLWQNTYSTDPPGTGFRSLDILPASNSFVVSGFSFGTGGWLKWDAFLMSLKVKDGKPIWSSRYGGQDLDAPWQVYTSPDGKSYVVAGNTQSFGIPDGAAWLFKVSQAGELDKGLQERLGVVAKPTNLQTVQTLAGGAETFAAASNVTEAPLPFPVTVMAQAP